MNDKLIITKYLNRNYNNKSDLVKLYCEDGENGKRVSRVMLLIEIKQVLGYNETDSVNEIIDEYLLSTT